MLYLKRKEEQHWRQEWVQVKAKHLQGGWNDCHAQHLICSYHFSFFFFFLETYHIEWRFTKCLCFDKIKWLISKHTSKTDMDLNCQFQKQTWFSQLDLLISPPDMSAICVCKTMDGKIIHFRLTETGGSTATCVRPLPPWSHLSLPHQAKSC